MKNKKREKICLIDKLIKDLYETTRSDQEIKDIYDEIKLINIKYGYNINDNKKRDI